MFFHVPKTAGLSIYETLGIDWRANLWAEDEENKLHSQALIAESKKFDYFTFAFVRNPWERLVSAYLYLQNGGIFWVDEIDRDNYLKDCPTFRDCILNIDNMMEQQHFRPMTYWLPSKLSFVGRYENLQNDFNTVCDLIGIERRKLPHINKTEHFHYSKYYDSETQAMVAERYAEDIDRFKYVFDNKVRFM